MLRLVNSFGIYLIRDWAVQKFGERYAIFGTVRPERGGDWEDGILFLDTALEVDTAPEQLELRAA